MQATKDAGRICTARALGGNVRPVRARLALLVAFVILGVRLDAHRLDEYLQATRVAIERGRVTVEIDLTPGASLAADCFEQLLDLPRNPTA